MIRKKSKILEEISEMRLEKRRREWGKERRDAIYKRIKKIQKENILRKL